MLTVNSEDRARIAPLFADMEDTMIRSCLQGRMGEAYADALPPACAQILLGDFAFLAGDVQASGAEELVRHIPRYLLVIPKSPAGAPVSSPPMGSAAGLSPATPPRGIPVSTGNSLAGWRTPCRRGFTWNRSESGGTAGRRGAGAGISVPSFPPLRRMNATASALWRYGTGRFCPAPLPTACTTRASKLRSTRGRTAAAGDWRRLVPHG